MLLLQRLTVRALKGLRDIDITFPQRGAILIEGLNESGKSTLFEAIYFALYGAALVGETAKATLSDLLPHSGAAAHVTLTLQTDAAQLTIRRTLTPSANGSVKHDAHLRVQPRHPDAPPEPPIATVAAVNTRLLQELHGLDGDLLRNSCYMEQKALDRLESLSKDRRELAVAKLIGLDRLRRAEDLLTKELDPLQRAREQAQRRRDIALQRQQLAQAHAHARHTQQRLSAAQTLTLLHERDALTATLATLHHERDAADLTRLDNERRLERASAARNLLTTLEALETPDGPLGAAQEADARRRATLGALDDLTHIAHEQLPPREAQLHTIATLEALRQRITLERAAQRRADDALSAQAAATAAATALDDATQRRQAVARAQVATTLSAWARLRDGQERAATHTTTVASLERHLAVDTASTAQRRAQVSRALTAALLTSILVCALLGAGVFWRPALALCALSACLALALIVRWARLNATLRASVERLTEAGRRLAAAHAEQETAQRFVGALDDLPRLEASLQAANVAIPTTAQAARDLLTSQYATDATYDPAAENLANDALARSRAEYEAAQSRMIAARQSLAQALAALHADANETDDTPLPAELSQEWRAARFSALDAHERQAQELLTQLNLPPDIEDAARALAALRGALDAEIQPLRLRLIEREPLQQQLTAHTEQLTAHCARLAEALRQQHAAAQYLAPTFDLPPLAADADLNALTTFAETLSERIAELVAASDEQGAREELATLAERQRRRAEDIASAAARRATLIADVSLLLRERGIAADGAMDHQQIGLVWPLLATLAAEPFERGALESEAQQAQSQVFHQSEQLAAEERASGLDGVELDAAHTQLAAAEAERAVLRHTLALELARQARTGIVRRVLPETEVYMRALLPELTAGRYRDAKLLADEDESGADLRIALWDEMAGRYVAKGLFSGGARDQCSLALRLAFALATLPKEVGTTPGFIFLDEPLSSFDEERSAALAQVLTSGVIGRSFAQTLLISHSQNVERGLFPYHLRMAGGRVAESDLPDAADAADAATSDERTAEPALVQAALLDDHP